MNGGMRMSGTWLYTISKRSQRYFELKDKDIPASPETCEELVNNGKLVEDRTWGISQNWGRIHPGDEVSIYTGDEDRGIIGYAHVAKVVPKSGGWVIDMKFDLGKCKQLLKEPVPAAKVREWVHY